MRQHREPSGTPFNSLVQLEAEQGTPRNPFINAGAIAVTDRLVSQGDPKAAMLELVSSLCGEPVHFDEEVAASEAATGFRNIALGNFMKSFGKIDNDVAAVLDLINGHQVDALVVNKQTETAVTKQLQDAARKASLPIVEVTETLPAGLDFLSWQRQTAEALAHQLDTAAAAAR